jgi:MscS family membrane protein
MILEHPIFQVIIIIVVVWVFNLLFQCLLNALKKRLLKRNKLWQLSLVSTLYTPVKYLNLFIAFIICADILCESFSGGSCFDPRFFAELGIFGAIGWFLLRWKSQWIDEMRLLTNEHKINWTPIQLDLVNKSVTIAILLITGVFLLEATGRGLQLLLAFSGIGGLVLAFASQQVVSNFFGGLMIYLTRPFMIGEWIVIPERKIEGYIEDIGWYMTRMRNMEKRPVYIPNSIFTQTFVVTPSRMSHQVVKEKLAIRHEDLPLVGEITQQIRDYLKDNARVDHHQKIKVFLTQIALSSVEIEIQFYIPSHLQQEVEAVKQEILLEAARVIERVGAKLESWHPSVL